jgi:hypothetical protein
MFGQTREAILLWEQASVLVDEILRAATSERDVWRACALERGLLMCFRETFFRETAHINTRNRAYLVHPKDDWLRRLCGLPSAAECHAPKVIDPRSEPQIVDGRLRASIARNRR